MSLELYKRLSQTSELSDYQIDYNWTSIETVVNSILSGATSGTVTSISASIFSGLSVTVINPTTTPNIAITTTLSGFLKGNGSGFIAQASIILSTDVSGIMPIANGGTNASSLTANTAIVFNGTRLASSSTTLTELGYVHGVTSSIQTQLDAKEPGFTFLPYSKGGLNGSFASRISALNNFTDVSSATAGYVLTKDGSGNATFVAPTIGAVTSVNTSTGAVVLTVSNAVGALQWATTNLNIPTADAGTTGLLSAADWIRFDDKSPSQWTSITGGIYYENAVAIGKTTFTSGYILDVLGQIKISGTHSTFNYGGNTLSFISDSSVASGTGLTIQNANPIRFSQLRNFNDGSDGFSLTTYGSTYSTIGTYDLPNTNLIETTGYDTNWNLGTKAFTIYANSVPVAFTPGGNFSVGLTGSAADILITKGILNYRNFNGILNTSTYNNSTGNSAQALMQVLCNTHYVNITVANNTGSPYASFLSDLNVGFGHNTPAVKWDFNGNIRLRGGNFSFVGSTSGTVTLTTVVNAGTWTWTVPTTAGTLGYSLITDGSGVTSWSQVSLTTGITGTLPIANGGSGQTTANGALNAFLPSQTSNTGKFFTTDGTNTSWVTNVSSPWGVNGSSIYYNAGNVGIGTSSPPQSLSLAGDSFLSFQNILGGTGEYGAIVAYNQLVSLTTQATAIRFLRDVAVIGTDGAITFETNTVERMRISSNGNIGIRTTGTAYLNIAGGTATAGTSPLKLNSGTNLTTPEAGATEFNGTQLFFTPSSTRNILAQVSGSTALTPGSIVFATTNGYLTQDNSSLFWNNSTKKLGIGNNSPLSDIDIQNTNASINIQATGGSGVSSLSLSGSISNFQLGDNSGHSLSASIANVVNPIQFGSSSNHDLSIITNNILSATFKTGGNLELIGGIKTVAPSGHSAGVWKIGNLESGKTITGFGDKIIWIDVDGTVMAFGQITFV